MSNVIVPWQIDGPAIIPTNASSAAQIAPLAKQLRPTDIAKVIQAFDNGLCELGVEYLWKRTMSILKRELSHMGMRFVGEMLNRPDINDDSIIELAITDFEAIQLAFQLGIINRIGAMELRQAAELLSYYANPDADDVAELSYIKALDLLRSCVAYILARDRIDAALDFADFRKKLTQAVLTAEDGSLIALFGSPYFFKRTTIRVLLADIRSEKGAQVEKALGNFGTIVGHLWGELQEPDRWQIGQAYAEANSDGVKLVSGTLRRILMEVNGFDYVPETLRSSTYSHAAKEVLAAHEQFNNFYNEPAPMQALASLGSTIPGPAFQICMQATLAVKLGNAYGVSNGAQRHAERLLKSISQDRWRVYLQSGLTSDDMILRKLTQDLPSKRWVQLVSEYSLFQLCPSQSKLSAIIKAAADGNDSQVRSRTKVLLQELGVL